MTIDDELSSITSLFIDTAPIIYFIEAHPQFGPLSKKIFDSFLSGRFMAYSSVITLTEVLAKPVESGDEKLSRRFSEFLERGKISNSWRSPLPSQSRQADFGDNILSCAPLMPFSLQQLSTPEQKPSSRTTRNFSE